ncbi:MarR family winged helix-turn-helix transcriptional regulator [Demequina pelophila]|uniref:MarR family winged helix-turn-helix transcriptional regulator n=1 Tax=Demequina pelophila TaxID=1638984 RepID=UPI000783FE87|nr:MarR family transcriptional regulator [Demequina pelophila]
MEGTSAAEGGRLGDDLSFLIARANALSISAANAVLKPLDLNVRSYALLALVAGEDPAPTQREIAAFLRLDPSQVVGLVDALEGRGLIERLPDPRDRRARTVTATAAGRTLAGEARAAALEAERTLHPTLTPSERETLIALLRRVAFAD